jgi:ABC-2 type transport system ATP-binding protein
MTLDGIHKRFLRRARWVLQGIDLELEPGTSTVVMGGNGSGKSTLLRIAAGLCRPTSGKVTRPSRLGYVPDRQPASIRMTGREYVAHMGRIRGLDRATIDARSAELFERLDLKPGPEIAFSALSKGNRQKLLLSQALLVRVPTLILDEPFTGLDVNAVHALREIITEAQDTGTSVLMSAHEVETLPISTRVLHLTDGVLSEDTAERPVHDERVAGAVQVQLGVGTSMGNAHSISDFPGVMSVHSDSRQGVTLLLQPEYREAILGAAIAAGWHVLSVGPPGGGFESL